MLVPEILAPAGNMEALKAALATGADAVYLGGKLFNARHYAHNFDDGELAEAVRLVHRFRRKIYVTVNVLLHDRELEEALKYLRLLYDMGVDAVIVQDLGLVYLVRAALPHLKLHGSTQMTIHNLDGARFMADQGLARIVLARELSLHDIQAIRGGCGLELEVFVHGALCFCYSGQCLMSSMIGGRSGNRGRCAQPCRLPYRLLETSEGELPAPGDYLLSPKDLSTIDLLPRLVRSGVQALKFEGRMKRPEYVATVIRVYRGALDRCLSDPENYRATAEEKRQLAQIFNRDFTTGYYLFNPGANLISYQRPNNRGVYLGRIGSINRRQGLAEVKLEQPLSLGDGIEYWVSKGGRTGVTVRRIILDGKEVTRAPAGSRVELEVPTGVRSGDRVFKTHDEELIRLAQASYTRAFRLPAEPVRMVVSGAVGKPLELTVCDEAGHEVQARTGFLAEEARTRPLTKEVLEEQLGRLGNTGYVLQELELNLPGNLMVPLSELNALRRAAVEQLDTVRKPIRKPVDEGRFQKSLAEIRRGPVKRRPRVPRLAVAVGDPVSLEKAVAGGADYIYIGGEYFRSKAWKAGDWQAPVRKTVARGVKVYYALPRLWLESNAPLIEKLAQEIRQLPVSGLLAGNPAGLQWAAERFPGLPVILDYPFNIFNAYSVKFVSETGIQGVTLSPELTFQEISELAIPEDVEFEGLIHGSVPLMVSEHCVVGSVAGHRTEKNSCRSPCRWGSFYLTDRMNYRFPVEMDQFCRMHIFNSQDLCLLDQLPKFYELGYHRVRIEARRESPAYVGRVVEVYREALTDLSQGRHHRLESLKGSLEKLSPRGFTKGHYFRGV